jgi:hypothetical protein
MIAGLYSVAELKDLIKAKDYDLDQLGAHYAAFAPTWVNADSASFVAWTDDWSKLQQAYDAARADGETAISEASLVLGSDNDIQADAPYRAILTALNPTWAQDTPAPGSLIDLDARLSAASGAQTDYSQQPQPTPGTDADLNALNAISPYDLLGGKGGNTDLGKPTTWPTWLKWTAGIAAAGGLTWAADQAFDLLGKAKRLLT